MDDNHVLVTNPLSFWTYFYYCSCFWNMFYTERGRGQKKYYLLNNACWNVNRYFIVQNWSWCVLNTANKINAPFPWEVYIFFSETESFKYRKSEKTKTSIYILTCIIQTMNFLFGPLQATACKSPQTLQNLNTATYQIKIKFYTSEKHRLKYKHRIINVYC